MEQTDNCQKAGGLGGWMKEGEGIKQKYIYITCRQKQQCNDSQR